MRSARSSQLHSYQPGSYPPKPRSPPGPLSFGINPPGGFFAFSGGEGNGLFLASGDTNGDGRDDIIVSLDSGGRPRVKVFSGVDGAVLHDFDAYHPLVRTGVRIASGDVDGDGLPSPLDEALPKSVLSRSRKSRTPKNDDAAACPKPQPLLDFAFH